MPERIYKLQPNRTIHLRGFDGLGASAAVHSATSNSFKVSGSFRDAADFAVVVLYDADNFFEHPRLKYLPDFDFSGLTLQFDVHYTNLMQLDSPKFPTIDWPYLGITRAGENSTSETIRLIDYASPVGGTHSAAQGSISIQNGGFQAGDRIVLWYLNYAFEYTVRPLECAFGFSAAGPGTDHWIDVDGIRYQTTEVSGDTTSMILDRLVSELNGFSRVHAVNTGGFQIDLRNVSEDGTAYSVAASSSPNIFTLHGESTTFMASFLAQAITNASYHSEALPITATASGSTITIQCQKPGVDGNFIRIYTTSSSSRLDWNQTLLPLEGGSSDVTWRITLNFSAFNIEQIRRMWLTFSPSLRYGASIDHQEWEAVFTNWTLSGPEDKKALSIAGPDSVRVEENDRWCSYNREWPLEEGFFSQGFAKRSSIIGDQVTIQYSCAATHDLYVGTSLYSDRASVEVMVDGIPQLSLNCRLVTDEAVNTRRKIATGIAPGEHQVTLRQISNGYFYFDYLEAAVPGDVPDALPMVPYFSPALDYSTDHTYKLPPERILWSFDQLGFGGPLNEYLGVFWWNQRKRTGFQFPSVTVTFLGTFNAGDAIFLRVGDQTIGKSVFAGEDTSLFARHFEYFINSTFVGVYASATGNALTITSRSASPAYRYEFQASTNSESTGQIQVSGSLNVGVEGKWEVDPGQSPPINAGARAWLLDMFSGCQSRNREIVMASSMELVNPPAGFATFFPDGEPVETSVGFGNLISTHCAFSSAMLNFQKSVYQTLTGWMSSRGLTPLLQFGEFVWWFFSNWSSMNPSGGMGFHDAETLADAQTALGRPLHRFIHPNDDPSINGYADAAFLRNRLRDYVQSLVTSVRTSFPAAKFEVLFPYDVAHPVPAGIHQLGGALNRFVNFPEEWESKSTSGFDLLKIEALDFGAWCRDLDLCKRAIQFPLSLDWPLESLRYLSPVFRPASVWKKEYLLARGNRIPIVNFWAYDHFCLHGIDPREPQNQASSSSS